MKIPVTHVGTVDRCQVHAIQIENDLTIIDKDRCIGCGLCASVCSTESISLVHKTPDEASAIFLNDREVMQAMALDKNKEYPFE